MLKIWHQLNYKITFASSGKGMHFWMCTDDFGMVACYNWASTDVVASLLSADMS